MPSSLWKRLGLLAATSASLLMTDSDPSRAQNPPGNGKVVIEYVPPTVPQQQPVYDLLRSRRALEGLQEIFSPYLLPLNLTITTKTCGMDNAWYNHNTRSVTLCYEYIDDFLNALPKETTATGVTFNDAVHGQFMYVAGHEMGHAMFDYLNVPLFGNVESAADHFSAYLMLSFGKEEARRLLLGAAYAYNNYVQRPTVRAPLQAFSDVHGAPMQRYFNLLCMAVGADPQTFGDIVEKGYLPKQRASDCGYEFDEVNYAFNTTVAPYINKSDAAKVDATIVKVLNQRWLQPRTTRPLPPKAPVQ